MTSSYKNVPDIITKKKVLELINNNTEASLLVNTRTCDISAIVGDLVMESSTSVNTVDVASDNTDLRPVFGIIIEKVDSTTAKILLIGTISGFSGLTKGNQIFLSITGSITSTPPITGYLQSLGVAKESTEVDFNPKMQRVKRV